MKCKKKSKLKIAQAEAQAAINETNQIIEELGKHSSNLCAELNSIQELFDEIRNMTNYRWMSKLSLKNTKASLESLV